MPDVKEVRSPEGARADWGPGEDKRWLNSGIAGGREGPAEGPPLRPRYRERGAGEPPLHESAPGMGSGTPG